MKLKWYILLLTAIVVAYYLRSLNKNYKYNVAIIQSCSHDSLDKARDGFIQEIRARYSDDMVKISCFNGEGVMSTILALSQQLTVNKDINMFYTIGSSPTQSIYNLEKERPLLFAAVSDPMAIGIDGNLLPVCGVSDTVEIDTPLHIISSIIPQAKKIGLIYSSSTLNENEARKIKAHLEEHGKEVIKIIIENENELSSILDVNLSEIDVLLSLCDNIVAQAIPLISKKTISAKVPFIACFNDATKNGALASCGTNYYEDGRKLGRFALNIIDKKGSPRDFGVQKNRDLTIYVNSDTAKKLGLSIPKNKHIVLI